MDLHSMPPLHPLRCGSRVRPRCGDKYGRVVQVHHRAVTVLSEYGGLQRVELGSVHHGHQKVQHVPRLLGGGASVSVGMPTPKVARGDQLQVLYQNAWVDAQVRTVEETEEDARVVVETCSGDVVTLTEDEALQRLRSRQPPTPNVAAPEPELEPEPGSESPPAIDAQAEKRLERKRQKQKQKTLASVKKAPVELVTGLMVQCYREPPGHWEQAVVEAVDEAKETVTISFVSDAEALITKQYETALGHDEECFVRSALKGPVSLGDKVYSSSLKATVREETGFQAINLDGSPKGRRAQVSYWDANSGYNYGELAQSESGTAGASRQERGSFHFKWSESPTSKLKRSNTCDLKLYSGGGEFEQATQGGDAHSSARGLPGHDPSFGQYPYQGEAEEVQGGQQVQTWDVEQEFRGWSPSKVALLQGGMQGLENIGNTCFMNAVLQCLQHCGPLVHEFFEHSFPKAKDDKHRLVTAVLQMMQRQWYSDGGTPFRPTLVKSLMSKTAKQFRGKQQHDAQEFLMFVLDAMHEELNTVEKKVYKEMKDDPDASEQQVSLAWWENYSNSNKSLVKDLFVGQIKSEVSCSSCDYVSTTFDPFWSLSLPMPSADGTTPCSLEDCLALFSRPEKLSGDNKYYCTRCKDFTESIKSLTLYRCPKVLVLHLKRFGNGVAATRGTHRESNTASFTKLGCPISVPADSVDMRPYAADTGHKDNKHNMPEPLLYDLSSVVNHLGASGAHGHYTADCFEPRSDTWCNFDDSAVTPTQRIAEESAYILFYVRQEESAPS